jgi:hypothetical protein
MSFELGNFEKRSLEKLNLTPNDFNLVVGFRNNFVDYLHKHYPWNGFKDQDLKERINKIIFEMDDAIENLSFGVPLPPGHDFRNIIKKTFEIQTELVKRKKDGNL